MKNTAQANEAGFHITEDIAGGRYNPNNPEHGGRCWIFYAMNLIENWNKPQKISGQQHYYKYANI